MTWRELSRYIDASIYDGMSLVLERESASLPGRSRRAEREEGL